MFYSKGDFASDVFISWLLSPCRSLKGWVLAGPVLQAERWTHVGQ